MTTTQQNPSRRYTPPVQGDMIHHMKRKNSNRYTHKQLHDLFNKMAKKKGALPQILRDTVMDLRQKKEIGLFITAVIIPGGMFAYAGYRAKKYFDKRAANDNINLAPQQKNIQENKADKKLPTSQPKP